MDVAPTVLELFGLTPPAHMDGRGLVDPAVLAGANQGQGKAT
jgi:arylsulfatase A-like enzyme